MRDEKKYGQPLLLYPGISLRIGSMVQIYTPQKKLKKESVDKLVDKRPPAAIISKNKPSRAVCSKNRH